MNDGRWETEYVYHPTTPGIRKTIVYDVKELRVTGVAVQLPTDREQWKILHHSSEPRSPAFTAQRPSSCGLPGG